MKTESFTFLEDKQWMRIEPSSSPTASKSTGINIKYVAIGLIGLPKAATLCSFYAAQYHSMTQKAGVESL